MRTTLYAPTADTIGLGRGKRDRITKVLPVREGVVHFSDEIRFSARPMVGVVGVATGGEEVVNAMPGKHGGNLDDHLHGVGTRIYFSVHASSQVRVLVPYYGGERRDVQVSGQADPWTRAVGVTIAYGERLGRRWGER